MAPVVSWDWDKEQKIMQWFPDELHPFIVSTRRAKLEAERAARVMEYLQKNPPDEKNEDDVINTTDNGNGIYPIPGETD